VTKNCDKSWIGNEGGGAAQELQVNNLIGPSSPTFSAQLTALAACSAPRFDKKVFKKNPQKKLLIVF
jgi:hypothetical protein